MRYKGVVGTDGPNIGGNGVPQRCNNIGESIHICIAESNLIRTL